MVQRLKHLFNRYCHFNIRFAGRPQPLHLHDGTLIGYIESIEISGGLALISGWSLLDGLTVTTTIKHKRIRRRLHRGDVVTALGLLRMQETGNSDGRVGFAAEVEWEQGTLSLCSAQGKRIYHWPLPVPSIHQQSQAAKKALLTFTKIAARSIPLGAKYVFLGHRFEHKVALKRRLGLTSRQSSSRTLSRLFIEADHVPVPVEPFTAIMPIYNAFDMLHESLARFVANTDLPWHLILIEDASPDPRVRPWVRKWAQEYGSRITLIENERNLGFIGSVNRGLEFAGKLGQHVVLLNSDAFVPKGWASRLLHPIISDARVASVTPMSNDATLFSIPSVAGTVQLEPGAVDFIDATAAAMSSNAKAEVPTGVGFCMALNRAALKKVPNLDITFGRGYGEEVDWCQRAREHGMMHIGIGNLFVEHRGGQSFGSETKIRAIDEAGRIIASRYPSYDADVQHFIKRDPLFTSRLGLSIAYAASRQSLPLEVYLAHSLGGGAEHWLRERIRNRAVESRSTIVIRVGGNERFSLELHLPEDTITGETDDMSILIALIRAIPNRHIIYSCGVGDAFSIQLPHLLCEVSAGGEATLEIMFHDYLPISPSFNLLDSTEKFTGVPPLDSVDPVHQPRLPDGRTGTLREWRDAWGKAIRRANAITVFSGSSRDIVLQVWPETDAKMSVKPHALTQNVPLLKAAMPLDGHNVSLAVLGSIGNVKGAQIVSDLAWYLHHNPCGLELVVIGEFDMSFSLPPNVSVTGRYHLADLEALASKYRVAAWLMPSICPETFSFTIHEMLGTGLPVLAFDIGAQGEAVKRSPNGRIVDLTPEAIIDGFLTKETQVQECA